MPEMISETNFDLPRQIGEVYRGKVGDVYTLEGREDIVGGSELLAVVRTDRISAFDVVLPQTIPHKGAVLNQMSARLLEATADTAQNWLLGVPDPNVSIGVKAEPVKVEMIMRAGLLGSAWRAYDQDGTRQISGADIPEGMEEFELFPEPLVTPTTKADEGHDENITPEEIIAKGLATEEGYTQMEAMSRALFTRGQAMAAERGLLLGDTKYEFGRLVTGKLVIIDEVHTPDSSRYFPRRQYMNYLWGITDRRPEQLSKEFVREWLAEQGFTGEAGQVPPDMPPEFVQEVSDRYIGLGQQMLKGKLTLPEASGRLETIENKLADFSTKLVKPNLPGTSSA